MRSLLALLIAATSVTAVQPPPVNYDGVQVLRVPVVGEEHVDRVNRLASLLDLQTWKAATKAGGFADFVVRPEQVDAFRAAVGDLDPIVMHQDLGASIAKESAYESFASSMFVANLANETWFDSYHAYADHIRFLQDLQAQHPNNAEIVSSGQSAQGNDITGIHLFGKNGKGSNPAVVFHATAHAREWITTMVVEYMAYTLLRGYASDANMTRYLDTFDFIIFPVVNPDGFLYTQKTDRLWRKNRQRNPGSACMGRDINRNWAYQWDLPNGASSDPCREDFKGAQAGDAPEIQALAAFLKKTAESQGIKIFMDYHAYSQLLMTPYAYSCDAHPKHNDEYQKLAHGAVKAILGVHGVSFEAGSICSIIYPASGSSLDFVADVMEAEYAFAIELRDDGKYGFVLPADQIRPSGEETLAGVRYLLDHVR